MTYYSPGTKFNCPSCKSLRIGFIFSNTLRNIFQEKKQIRQNQVILSDSKYDSQSKSSWLCYDCYDCGNVQKKEIVN